MVAFELTLAMIRLDVVYSRAQVESFAEDCVGDWKPPFELEMQSCYPLLGPRREPPLGGSAVLQGA